MFNKLCAGALLLLVPLLDAYAVEPEFMDAPPLPLATKRLPASAEECEVWRADFHSSQSMQTHDEAGWVADMHPGVIFNVGTKDAPPAASMRSERSGLPCRGCADQLCAGAQGW